MVEQPAAKNLIVYYFAGRIASLSAGDAKTDTPPGCAFLVI
jgi:hypothetical protein